MRNRSISVCRQGHMYHFSIENREYTAFIWQHGKQFCGRVEGNPHVPESTGRTALAVRDMLRAWIITHVVA